MHFRRHLAHCHRRLRLLRPALLLQGAGVVEGNSLPFGISGLHATFFVVALAILGKRVWPAFRRPIPITFGLCMTTVCVASWLGTR